MYARADKYVDKVSTTVIIIIIYLLKLKLTTVI